MNIGIVTTWFERGAAYVSRQYMQLLMEKHNVFIYARGGEEFAKNDPKWDGANVHWGKNYHTVLTKISTSDLKRWIEYNKIDILFFNEQHIWDPLVELNRKNIITGAYVDYYTQETVGLFGSYDFLICNTQRHLSAFNWHPQSYYLPWGTDIDLYKPSTLKIDNNKLTFFHSAGMNPYRKGTDIILKACDIINQNNFKIIIHTQTRITDFFPDLKELIIRLEKEKKLEIINKTISAPGLYYLGDIYLYPSRLEGIGLTIHEAACSGLPVITTDEAPMNEFIKPNINGRLVSLKSKTKRNDGYFWDMVEPDENNLASQMIYYLENFASIGQFKSQARLYAEKNFNWLNNEKDINNIFSKVESLNDSELKNKAIRDAVLFERKRPISYYIKASKPYINAKKRIKKLLKP